MNLYIDMLNVVERIISLLRLHIVLLPGPCPRL